MKSFEATLNKEVNCHVLIVGYPNSGSEFVEQRLRAFGMQNALHSRMQQLDAKEISSKLLQLSKISPNFIDGIYQLAPTKIWDELALDLFLGNIEIDFLGWSDPHAVYLLNYWRDIDPDIRFVFVFDTPANVFSKQFQNSAANSYEFDAFVKAWTEYNTELLCFFTRNRNRCLLVESGQISVDPGALDNAIKTLLNRSLQDTKLTLIDDLPSQNVVAQLLADLVIRDCSSLTATYEDLRVHSSIPLNELSVPSGLDVWAAYVTSNLVQISPIMTRDKTLLEENELLLLQLHHAQEEYERYYLENQQLKHQGKRRPTQLARVAAPLYGAAERVKRQLTYRLGNTMLIQSRSLAGWLAMPGALLKQVREFEQENRVSRKSKLPPLSKYADAHEAEKFKSHLSYRLGSALLANYRTPIGWIKLPWAIRNQIKEFNRDRALKK